MDEEDATSLVDSYQMLQNIRLQNNNVYLFPTTNSVIQQNCRSVVEQYTTPQEVNENEMDDILTEEVRKLNVIWDPTCRGYKDQTKVNAAWKEVSNVMSEIAGKNHPETVTWSCSYKNAF